MDRQDDPELAGVSDLQILSVLAAGALSFAFSEWWHGRRLSRQLDRALDMTDQAIQIARRAQDLAGFGLIEDEQDAE